MLVLGVCGGLPSRRPLFRLHRRSTAVVCHGSPALGPVRPFLSIPHGARVWAHNCHARCCLARLGSSRPPFRAHAVRHFPHPARMVRSARTRHALARLACRGPGAPIWASLWRSASPVLAVSSQQHSPAFGPTIPAGCGRLLCPFPGPPRPLCPSQGSPPAAAHGCVFHCPTNPIPGRMPVCPLCLLAGTADAVAFLHERAAACMQT